jgi:hypothetical protein
VHQLRRTIDEIQRAANAAIDLDIATRLRLRADTLLHGAYWGALVVLQKEHDAAARATMRAREQRSP